MRLIDADHVLKALGIFNDYEHGNWHFLSGIETAREIIDDALTVDAELIRHGQWKGKPIAGYSTVRCSECGDVFLENSGRWNYCPNCGARMDGNK